MFHIKILILSFLLVFTFFFASSVKNDFVVSSDLLGKIEAHYEGPGRVYVYVDYLDKTVTYEQLQQDK